MTFYNYVSKGTIFFRDDFDAGVEAEKLREAMKGCGTDEDIILDVLGNHTLDQRLQLAEAFKVAYGQDLVDELASELRGDFEKVCLALLTPIRLYDAKQIHEAISGAGTNESVLVEIMCSRSNDEINEIKELYKQEFESDMEEDLISDTGGYFKRLMVSLCAAGRESDQWEWTDDEKAAEDAQMFFDAGEGAWGTEEAEINAILCLRSPGQLLRIIEKYELLKDGVTIEDAIRSECSGTLQEGYLAIVECVKSKPHFFARRLNDSMSGFGTQDDDLIRIIVSRSEIDMENIKEAFEQLYGRSLADAIESECSGDYKRLLSTIIQPPRF